MEKSNWSSLLEAHHPSYLHLEDDGSADPEGKCRHGGAAVGALGLGLRGIGREGSFGQYGGWAGGRGGGWMRGVRAEA